MAARRLCHLGAVLHRRGRDDAAVPADALLQPSTSPAAAGDGAPVAGGGAPASPTTITGVRCYAIKLPDIRMICVVKIETAGGLSHGRCYLLDAPYCSLCGNH
jgi:hypothetical protein